ncbi:hypothetical protein DL766_008248 [Monosporascus sp. MC13-8B]|nr:hypothetical protein DL763_010611 [Monosporascus cannonballus]RYP20202.1 hypothetical protein DL766_008248 [Monosporascus sp. MC13-8B]
MVVEEEITTADIGELHEEGMEVAQCPSRVERHVKADAYGRRRVLVSPDVASQVAERRQLEPQGVDVRDGSHQGRGRRGDIGMHSEMLVHERLPAEGTLEAH